VRVLIDIGRLGRGGAERQVAQLASGLARRGHSCVLAVHKSVDAYDEYLRESGVLVRSFCRMRKYDARVFFDLVSLYRRARPDVILAVEFNATLWGRMGAVLLRTPCVTAEHASKTRFPAPVLLTHRLLARFTRCTVACSSAQIPYLVAAGNPRGSIVVIRNGVDVAEFYPDIVGGSGFREAVGIPSGAVVVGLVAAHRDEKRHDRFVRLIRGLHRLGIDAWGCMVGGGPLLDVTRRWARESPIADRLVITGPIVGTREAYNAFDLVALVSDTETFPLCLLEAQACARPVIGFDVGGVRETLCPDMSGLLVRAGDEEGMAQSAASLLRDEARLRTMGGRGRKWVERNLSLDRMLDEYESLLGQVAGGWRAGV
jgi:glycosyltransferase involved in cell wall biosynthesis